MILVTGGTGLVGSHLLYHLAKNSNGKIRAIKRSGNIDSVLNLFKFYDYNAEILFNKIEWINANVTDVSSLEPAFNQVSQVYHCAAIISFNPKENDLMQSVNIGGTRNIVNIALEYNVKKICYVSSIAALGSSKGNDLISETDEWKKEECTSNYSESKHLSELEVWRGFSEGLDGVIVNPSAIIGPSNRSSGTGLIFKTLLKGNKFYPLGSNSFVCVNDVARVMMQLMAGNISGEQFIVTSENLSHKILADIVSEELGVDKPTIPITPFLSALAWRVEKIKSFIIKSEPIATKEFLREANADVSYSNKKIRDAIGYKFKSVRQAVKDAARFYKD